MLTKEGAPSNAPKTPQTQTPRPAKFVLKRFMLLLMLAVVAGVACLAYGLHEEKTKLRAQVKRLVEERSDWGKIFSRGINQQINDALFARWKHGPGAFTEFEKTIQRVFGGGEKGAVAQEIKLGYLTPDEGSKLMQGAQEALLRRKSTIEYELAKMEPTRKEQVTRRIEPGDIVFKNWSYLAAFMDENGRCSDEKEMADLLGRYVESGKIWEIPSSAVANIEGYYDALGNSTEPRVVGDRLYAAGGTVLFAKISWDGKEGYMALGRTQ